MDSEVLCYFCDAINDINATKCIICVGEIRPDFKVDIAPNIQNNDHNAETKKLIEMKAEDLDSVEKKSEQSKWTCSQCTCINNSDILCCVACFQNRKIEVDDEVVESVDQETPIGWKCTSCSCINNLDVTSCRNCKDLRTKDLVDDVAENDSTENADKIEITIWFCKVCTYKNGEENITCIACHSPNTMDDTKMENKNVDPLNCSNRNEIDRVCEQCNRGVITNDKDTSCLDCLEKAQSLLKRSASFDVKNTYSKNGHGDENNNETNLFKSDGCLVFMEPNKRSLKVSFVKKVRSHVFAFKDKHRWHCRNGDCDKANREKLQNCKRCGTSKPNDDRIQLLEEGNSVFYSIVEEGLPTDKSVPSKKSCARSFWKGRNKKQWFCSDTVCGKENHNSKEKCEFCGKIRSSTDQNKFDRSGSTIFKSKNKGNLKCMNREVSKDS